MNKIYYHGTSADNLANILANGLQTDTDKKLWSVSDNKVYLWNPEALTDYDTEEAQHREAFKLASESGQAACTLSIDCRIVVLKLHINDEEIEEDDSSENMASFGAVQIRRDIMPSEILEIQISNDVSILRVLFIYYNIQNEFTKIKFSPLETRIAKAFSHAEIYTEDIEEVIEWSVLPLNNQ